MNIDESFLPVTSAHSLPAVHRVLAALTIPALPLSAPASSLLQLARVLLLYMRRSPVSQGLCTECPLRELSGLAHLQGLSSVMPPKASSTSGSFPPGHFYFLTLGGGSHFLLL